MVTKMLYSCYVELFFKTRDAQIVKHISDNAALANYKLMLKQYDFAVDNFINYSYGNSF